MNHLSKMVLLVLVSSLLLGLESGCKEEGCTNSSSFNYNPDAKSDDGTCLDMHGCLGYAGGYDNSGQTGITLNNYYFDQKMNEEVYLQRQFFGGVPANVFIWYEPNPAMKNAFASPNGNILFGYEMFYYTVLTYGELPVAGVLAHEWGHRAQQTIGWAGYKHASYKELEADAFSGYYMALSKQWAWSQIEGYYANVYATGDYNFNSPLHHGTPDQRLASAYLGVLTAIDVMASGLPYSYNRLHEIFLTEIETNIAPRSDKPEPRKFEEVIYPQGLTPEYVRSLYPHL